MEKEKVTTQVLVSSGIDKCWNAYTNPEHITKWNFASDDWQCPHASNDMRVGGKYMARMEAKDGSFGFDFEATYLELVPGESFIYVLGDGRVVSVKMQKENELTSVTVIFEAETQNPVELQRNGWQTILDNFKKYAEAN